VPEPVLVAVATAVASKAALDLYGLVKGRFEHDRDASGALEDASRGDERAIEALAEHLERVERLDPEFGRAVRAAWQAEVGGRVANTVVGDVVGKSFQGRDVHGDVNL
jgi:hypothetical protein